MRKNPDILQNLLGVKKKSKKELLKDVVKPQLRELGIIPNMQIEATNTEQLENVKSLLETIQTMPKLGKGKHEAKLHYFVGGIDYYIIEDNSNYGGYGAYSVMEIKSDLFEKGFPAT